MQFNSLSLSPSLPLSASNCNAKKKGQEHGVMKVHSTLHDYASTNSEYFSEVEVNWQKNDQTTIETPDKEEIIIKHTSKISFNLSPTTLRSADVSWCIADMWGVLHITHLIMINIKYINVKIYCQTEKFSKKERQITRML